jgi:hypothetical protein
MNKTANVTTDPQCIEDRGNLFYPFNSSTWKPVGRYTLGSDKELGNRISSDYGLDSVTVGTNGPTIPSSIIGPFNSTQLINTTFYMTGFFGLGITSGTFDNKLSPVPALPELAAQKMVPGMSYGFTAGAHYREILHFW